MAGLYKQMNGYKGFSTVSAAIKQKLIELNEKVQKLEAAAAGANAKVVDLKNRPAVAAKPVKQQADLFTVFTGGQQKDMMRSMASRLDSTIEKVEELLKQN